MKLIDLQENLRSVSDELQYWYFREGEEQVGGKYQWTSSSIEKDKVKAELDNIYSEYGNYGPQVWMSAEGMEIIVGATSFEEATAKARQYTKAQI